MLQIDYLYIYLTYYHHHQNVNENKNKQTKAEKSKIDTKKTVIKLIGIIKPNETAKISNE